MSPVLRSPARTLVSALFTVAATSAAFAGCRSPDSAGDRVAASTTVSAPPRVSGAEARQLVKDGALLLDVRTEEEFVDGHIEGARNVPVAGLRAAMAQLPRDRPLVVYCAVGSRSAMAAEILHTAGYDVRNLGPMAAWGR